MNGKASDVGDLTLVVKELEQVFVEHFGGRPAMVIAFTLPQDRASAHWATNVSREDGIRVLQGVMQRMIAEGN
jgi:hypothetical protein